MKYFLTMLSLLLAACAPQAGHKAPDAVATAAKISSAGAQGHVKMGADVHLSNKIPRHIKMLSESLVNLELVSAETEGIMTVQVSTSRGLQLLSAVDEFEFNLAEQAVYKIPLEMMAEVEGRYYINLHIQTLVQGYKASRVLAAIVEVGSAERQTETQVQVKDGALVAPTRKKDLSGDEFILLPAQETIINH